MGSASKFMNLKPIFNIRNHVALGYEILYNLSRHREGVILTMYKMKLSTLVIGSAVVLGLGAVKGSFAAAPLAQEAARQIIISEAAAGAIAANAALSGQLAQMAASLMAIPAAEFAVTSQSVAKLNEIIASKQNDPKVQAFVEFYQSAETNSLPLVVADAQQRAQFRGAVIDMATRLGFSKEEIRHAATAIGGALFNAVAGHQIMECVKDWSDITAQKAFVYTLISMYGYADAEAWKNRAVKKIRENLYASESEATVLFERLYPAFNSQACKIAALPGAPNGVLPRPIMAR